MSNIQEKIKQCWDGNIDWNCPMKNYTTLKVGGCADALIKPGSVKELCSLVQSLSDYSVPWKVIGSGSNILVSDKGVDGVVIILGSNIADIKQQTEGRVSQNTEESRKVYVEAGCSLAKLIKWCADQSFSGLEFASGIPGTVGGAIYMNAGAWGAEIKDVLRTVSYISQTGEIRSESPEVNDFEYRSWKKKSGKTIVAAVFELMRAERTVIKDRCAELTRKRQEKQPKGVASAGSFFKNTISVAAGRLIDEAGLKGVKIGGAQVSEKHANFLVNTGEASSLDFYKLMKHVQMKVYEKFSIQLEPEVEFVGRW